MGYVTKHNPEKAKTQLEALDLGKGRRSNPGKHPTSQPRPSHTTISSIQTRP